MTINETAKRLGPTNAAKPNAENPAARAASPKSSAAPANGPQGAGSTTSAQGPTAQLPTRETLSEKKKTTYEERMRRLPPIVRVRKKLESTTKRFSKLADEVRRWKDAPALGDGASKVEAALAGLLAEATMMPDKFQPEKDLRASARTLTPGEKVRLRDKFVASYEGVLEPAERASLEVVSASQSHVSAKTVAGARIVLPRAHVTKTVTAT